MPEITGILETAMYVSDIARAARFYEGLFGLKLMRGDERFRAYDVCGRQVLLLFLHGGTTKPMALAGGVIPPHDGTGQYHMAFSCTAAELPKWEAKLAAMNIPIEGRVKWEMGGTSIYFRDPDQNLIEIVTPGIWPNY